ncbi:unnamed protein product, partial [Arabidopsis halleri]
MIETEIEYDDRVLKARHGDSELQFRLFATSLSCLLHPPMDKRNPEKN